MKNYSYPILNLNQTGIFIKDLLNSNKPFLISRFGRREFNMFIKIFLNPSKPIHIKYLKSFHKHTGFFPSNNENIKKWFEFHINNQIISEIDLLGSWMIQSNNVNNELLRCVSDPEEISSPKSFILDEILPNNKIISEIDLLRQWITPSLKISNLRDLVPFFHRNPWTQYLKNRNVLVIHPFVKSIKKQYKENRKFLFKNPLMLPKFNLQTIKSVQSIAGNIPRKYKNKTWFEALNDMYQEALSLNFDVAIIGCGSYGMPLGALLKKAGKQVIHLGGATQMLFGVYGERWFERHKYRKLINNKWVRPSIDEQPANFKKVEMGAYW